MSAASDPTAVFITPDAMLAHWQGHRRLTRRVIEAFPEDQLFSFSVGGMRPFGGLARELISMAAPMIRGAVRGESEPLIAPEATTRSEVLRLWDEATAEIEALWPELPPERFQERMQAFGVYEAPLRDLILYVIDNEIHHRGQGYVYLRALGIAPPPFWERH